MPRRPYLGTLVAAACLLITLTACGGGTSTAARAVAAASPNNATGGPPVAAATRGAATTGGATRFTIDQATSKATYEVKETFIGRGVSTAVGATSAITGDITINTAQPASSSIGTITVDISKLASDSNQRDNRIKQQWLESTKHPIATFVPKRLEGLPTSAYTEGQTLTFKIVGNLTIRTVTKEITFDATGKIVGGTFSGTAKTAFNMTDFGIDPPDIAGVLKAENGVVLTLDLNAKKAN